MQDKCPIYLGVREEVVNFPLHFYCVNWTKALSIILLIVFCTLRLIR